jgi:DNA-directed RNA polymerase alpha subunit
MKMTVEFNSIADLANFSKFIDQRLAEEVKAKEIDLLQSQLSLAKNQLERAYARLRFKSDGDSKVYSIKLSQLPITNRCLNALTGHGLKTIGDVIAEHDKNGLKKIINFGKGSYKDLQHVLATEHNIKLQNDIL